MTIEKKLIQKEDQLLAIDGEGNERPVRVVWMRPLTGWGREMSVLFEDGDKEEVFEADRLEDLEPETRALAQRALEAGYLMPRILRIHKTDVIVSGLRFWDVETDMGCRQFVSKNPFSSFYRVTDDELVVRDIQGNAVRIPSIAALDAHSKKQLEKVS